MRSGAGTRQGNMRSFKDIKKQYHFFEEDEGLLVKIGTIMVEHVEGAMEALHAWIMETPDAARFFANESKMSRVFAAHRAWFKDLFSGAYGAQYYDRLIRIGQKHVRAGVDAHYMNRATNLLRNYCTAVLNRSIDDQEERTRMMITLDKILDMNLDIITSAYIEEELRTYSSAQHVKTALINFSEGFARTMNLVLIISLIGLTLGVIGLFVFDLRKFITGDLEQGIITALGSMLILRVMIELMNTEIAHLKGGKFHISVFIGVALVAFIRETLIMTLKHESPEQQYYLIALILVLGIVFWLVTKAEGQNMS